VFHIHKDRVFQLQASQSIEKNSQFLDDSILAACIAVIIGAHPQPGGMGAVYVLQKIGVHIQTAVVAGTQAHNGELLSAGGYLWPVDAALIAGYINAVLKYSH